MELKSYDKPWLPALKGAFLIVFGILAILRIFGTIKSLAVLFAFLIGVIGILLITTGIRYKKSHFRIWTIVSGILHLGFLLYLGSRVDTAKDIYAAREGVLLIILVWIIFFAITEIIEAVILISIKNAFAALFILNALLTLLFAYFLHIVSIDFSPQGILYLGLIALIIGIANVLSAFLLSRIK